MSLRLLSGLFLALLSYPHLASAASLHVEVPTDTILVDHPFALRIEGLRGGQTTSIGLRFVRPGRGGEARVWSSMADYRADDGGVLDLGIAQPLQGSYEGIDPMGLIWSAERDTSQETYTDIAAGLELLEFEVRPEEAEPITVRVWRRRSAPDLVREEIPDSSLVGVFYHPRGTGPFPGVLILGGSECGTASSERKAALLASHGFAALGLAYCSTREEEGTASPRTAQLPVGVMDVPLEYVEHGLHWLQQQTAVAPGGVGVWGSSKGAELALLLASESPSIRAVIAVVPSHVVWQGITSPWRVGPSWTRDGDPVVFVPYTYDRARIAELSRGKPPGLRYLYLASLDYESAVEASAIPVEQIAGAVLLVSGEDDLLWPSTIMAESVVRRLESHEFNHPIVHLQYPEAGHGIGIPYYPTASAAEKLGGTKQGNARARADSWRKALEFLQEHMRDSN